MNVLRLFLRPARPIFLLGVALLYALGCGIARYLGARLDGELYLLGQAWVSALQLGGQYLHQYYTEPDLPVGDAERQPRTIFLYIAAACFCTLASLTVLVVATHPSPIVYFMMAAAFLGAFFYSAPLLRLERSGYGELTLAAITAFLTPAFAYALQEGELHRFVAMVSLPLTALYLAMLLALELPEYAADLKSGKCRLMVRMGWQRGMMMHNGLVLGAFFLFALFMRLGLPRFIAWPILLSLPLGSYQVWQIQRIADGVKTNWPLLRAVAIAVAGGSTYWFAFSFWIN